MLAVHADVSGCPRSLCRLVGRDRGIGDACRRRREAQDSGHLRCWPGNDPYPLGVVVDGFVAYVARRWPDNVLLSVSVARGLELSAQWDAVRLASEQAPLGEHTSPVG